MVGTRLHIRKFLICQANEYGLIWMLCRFTQIHYWLRCKFPVWSHWSAKLTRRGRVLQGIRRAVKASVFVALLAGFKFLYKNPEQRLQLVQSLLAGKAWLRSTVQGLISR
jgi:hypothetical protein